MSGKPENLLNDLYSRAFLDGNTAVVQDLVNIIQDRDDIRITEVIPQRHKEDRKARSVIFDALAVDSQGNQYGIEIQDRFEEGFARRLGYNLSLLIRMTLLKGDDHKDRLPVKLIAITNFRPEGVTQDLQIYHVARTYLETGELHPDGEEIIYLNVSHPPDLATRLGQLVHDILAENSEEMYLQSFKESTYRLKETEEGRAKMGEIQREIYLEGYLKGYIESVLDMLASGAFLSEEQIRKAASRKYTPEEVDYIVKEVMAS